MDQRAIEPEIGCTSPIGPDEMLRCGKHSNRTGNLGHGFLDRNLSAVIRRRRSASIRPAELAQPSSSGDSCKLSTSPSRNCSIRERFPTVCRGRNLVLWQRFGRLLSRPLDARSRACIRAARPCARRVAVGPFNRFLVERQVRTAAALLVLLVTTVWLVAKIEVSTPTQPRSAVMSPWRRTQIGWERSDTWLTAVAASRRPGNLMTDLPHPAIVALLELLVASFFLAAGPSPSRVNKAAPAR